MQIDVENGHELSVLFLVFNRPELTFETFETIRAAKPGKLYVAADGPRPDVDGEQHRVKLTRSVVERVDWDCEVRTLFRDRNLGCARAVSSAIDWVFESVEEVIVLEDDCQPSQSFFRFCSELLERYRYDERIMSISGDNFQDGRRRTGHSYYFSRYNHCWGWATWKRAWDHYDLGMNLWSGIRDGGWLADIFCDPLAASYWERIFDRVSAGEIDTWDYQWTFACWAQGGLSVVPSVNLVQNVGFSDDATHTDDGSDHSLPAEDLSFPIDHPPVVLRDRQADRHTQLHHYGLGSVSPGDRLRNFIRSLLAGRS